MLFRSPTVAGISVNPGGNKVTFGVVKGTANLNKYIIYYTDASDKEIEATSGTVVEGENVVDVTIPSGYKKVRVMVTDVNGESSSDTYAK